MTLKLVDKSILKSKGTLDDIIFSIDSWEYTVDFFVHNPRNKIEGHTWILVIPWLAIVDAYIVCLTGSMIIAKGPTIKNLILYPLAKLSLSTDDFRCSPPEYQKDNLLSPLNIEKALIFKKNRPGMMYLMDTLVKC